MAKLHETYRLRTRERVYARIAAWLRAEARGLEPSFARQVADYPLRRGKAARAALLTLFYGACGGRDGRAAVDAAAAYEMLESWGIGRDDILDGALLRRGGPALHVKYGLPSALNALDYLHVLVFKFILRSRALGAGQRDALFGLFAEASRRTLAGQHEDIRSRGLPLERLTEAKCLALAGGKTAYYTVYYPCLAGALLAGRKEPPALADFAWRIGTAFQLIDDVLDAENEGGGRFGKAVGNDIRERKRTLVLLRAYRAASPAERGFLRRLYEDFSAPPREADVRRARALMLRLGAPAEARRTAEGLAASALELFERRLAPGLRPREAGILRGLLGFLTGRDH